MKMETKKRSRAKSITWRIIAVRTTFTIVYLFTGSIFQASGITIVGMIVSTIEYYFHERIWNKIAWGYIEEKEGEQ